jgi:hypothetical protein
MIIFLNNSTNSTYNDHLILNDKQNQMFIDWNEKIGTISHPLLDDYTTIDDLKWPDSNKNKYFENFFISVITETTAEYPYPMITEKIFKTILYAKPFMLVAPRNTLKVLQDYGFKTFSDYWDESYDSLETVADRVDSIAEQLKMLSQKDKKQIDNMYQDMLPLLRYNQEYLKEFYNQQLEDFICRLN